MSYDDRKTLAEFSEKRGITFPLLSDAGSKTIDAYGLRNRDVAGTRMDGIPHPATFVLDDSGVIRVKIAYEGYRKRHAVDELLEAVAALP